MTDISLDIKHHNLIDMFEDTWIVIHLGAHTNTWTAFADAILKECDIIAAIEVNYHIFTIRFRTEEDRVAFTLRYM